MAELGGKLKALQVTKLTELGLHLDGAGLYLQVTAKKHGGVNKSWLYQFTMNGRKREMGLGPLAIVGLADARAAAADARRLVYQGIDPIEARDEKRRQAGLEAAKAIPFRKCAERFIKDQSAAWRNEKHKQQWSNTLATYAFPVIGDLATAEIGLEHVRKVLDPIWTTKPETAGRVRGRIETVLDWAKVHGYREGDNPARWRGHLDKLMPSRKKVARVKHHPALPHQDLPDFVAALRQQPGLASRALEFLILTAARTTEVTDAAPAEFAQRTMWILGPQRMKGDREHRVPLCDRAAEIVADRLKEPGGKQYVFPGRKAGKPMSNGAMSAVLDRMQELRPQGWRDEKGQLITVHGFRSTFRDWGADHEKNYPREMLEIALAHAVGDETEEAYRRSDLLAKRRALMDDWANFALSKVTATGST